MEYCTEEAQMGDIFTTQQANVREIHCVFFISKLFISSERVNCPSLKRHHRWIFNRLHTTIHITCNALVVIVPWNFYEVTRSFPLFKAAYSGLQTIFPIDANCNVLKQGGTKQLDL